MAHDFDKWAIAGRIYLSECDLRTGNGDPDPIGGLSINFLRTERPCSVLLALNAGDTAVQMDGQVSAEWRKDSRTMGTLDQLSLIEQGTTTGAERWFP